jgi:flagellar biosynthetic protein FliR
VTLSLNEATLVALLLCVARISAWVLIAPPFATSGLPRAIKPVLAIALALAVTPVAAAHTPSAEVAPLAGALLGNVVIGAGLGFGTRLVFAAVESAGSLIDLFGGFSLAFALDPLSQNNNSVFGRFYTLLTSTLLFATQAHLLVIAGFLRSFQVVPLDGGVSMARLSSQLIPGLTQMFVAALQIAGPLIIVLVLADLAMGLLNRIAPQLNVYSLSFPLKIMLTLALVGLGFTLLPQTINELAQRTVGLVEAVTG